MGLSVVFVSGIRRSGKSAIIRYMIERLWKRAPHYLRLVLNENSGVTAKAARGTANAGGTADAGNAANAGDSRHAPVNGAPLCYSPDRVFEVISEALTVIHRKDRYGSVVVEADAEPSLRHAYPWDHRLFVMPLPAGVQEVFRDPRHAAVEFQQVLDDTAAFASEIFGLFDEGGDDGDPHEERSDFTGTQMRRFLNSPLGDELATRIQLQPPYHGLVESDVVIVNATTGGGPGSQACIKRIERLLERTRSGSRRRAELLLCNPADPASLDGRRLIDALTPMCAGGK